MFSELGLSAPVLAPLARLGYATPTPVQTQAIPLVLTRRRSAGPRPDRHRQDRRLRAADDRTSRSRGAPRRRGRSRAASSSCRRVSSRCRCIGRCRPTARRRSCASPPSSAASAWARRSRRCSAAPTSSSPRRAGSSITCSGGRSICRRDRDPDARRSRSHARHGLPAGAAPDRQRAAARRARRCSSPRRSPRSRPARRPTSPATPCASTSRTVRWSPPT